MYFFHKSIKFLKHLINNKYNYKILKINKDNIKNINEKFSRECPSTEFENRWSILKEEIEKSMKLK